MKPYKLHIFSKLWNIDPGYLHLKHATKTVLTILIVLWFMRNEPLFIQLITGVISGFSMQGIVATSFSSRLSQILTLNTAYCLAFMLGLSVHTSANGSAIVLILLGFIANYLRQFGLQASSAPLMGWSLCFFATILPIPDIKEIWEHFQSILTALAISGFVNLMLFPQNYPRLFIKNSNQLFKMLSQGMRDIQYFTEQIPRQTEFNQLNFVQMNDKLSRLLANSQAIAQNIKLTEQTEQLTDHLLQQNGLIHSYSLITDAYRILLQHQHQLPQTIQQELIHIYQQYAILFSKLRMINQYSVVQHKPSIALPNLQQTLNDIPLAQPRIVLVLLNLKLSFNLFNQLLTKFQGTANET